MKFFSRTQMLAVLKIVVLNALCVLLLWCAYAGWRDCVACGDGLRRGGVFV